MPRTPSEKTSTDARKAATEPPKRPIVKLPSARRSKGKKSKNPVDPAELERLEKARKEEAALFRECISDIMARIEKLAKDSGQYVHCPKQPSHHSHQAAGRTTLSTSLHA